MIHKDNRTVGLAICYDYHDYGSMLQAYATQQKVESLGFKSEVINIDALKGSIRNRKLKYFAGNILDKSIVKEKSEIVKKKIRKGLCADFKRKIALRDKAFMEFCRENFHTSHQYMGWKELREGCRRYSSVLVGSDQLWLPSNIEADYYTLSFVPITTKKIAYATSFGVSDIPKAQEYKAKMFLNRIEFLSAREKTGQIMIKKYTGRQVPLVCDPALLLNENEWNQLTVKERIIEKKYIFCYFMGKNPSHREFVRNLKRITGYDIVSLLHLDQYISTDEEYADITPYDISPGDFINIIKNAEYVCTDSFHGTIFSIIFKRTFFTFKRFTNKATLSTNTRIDSLLEKFHLEERLIIKVDNIDEDLKKAIDYSKVHQYLKEFQKESAAYLIKALGNKDN